VTRKLFELEYCQYGKDSDWCDGLHDPSFGEQHLIRAYEKPWWFVNWCMSCQWKYATIKKKEGKYPKVSYFIPTPTSSMHIQLLDTDVPLCGHRTLPKVLVKNERKSYREMEEENDIPISGHWNRLFRRNKHASKKVPS